MAGIRWVHEAVPQSLVVAALRRFQLHILENGLTTEEIGQSHWGHPSFFWELRWCDEVRAIFDVVKPLMGVREDKGDLFGWPQIVMRYPHGASSSEEPHVDSLPDWADPAVWQYRSICQVALTDCLGSGQGGLVMVNPDGRRWLPAMRRGDALVFTHDMPHFTQDNLGCDVRWALYFRVLKYV